MVLVKSEDRDQVACRLVAKVALAHMDKDEQIQELTALLQQERAYVAMLKTQLSDLTALQQHMTSGLDVWKAGFEKLYHEHHILAGTKQSSACNVCLSEHEFPLSELVSQPFRPQEDVA